MSSPTTYRESPFKHAVFLMGYTGQICARYLLIINGSLISEPVVFNVKCKDYSRLAT